MADLYAGAGGTSTGAVLAARALGYEVDLTCVNHWKRAVETHHANHPWARHLCTGVDAVNPCDLYNDGELDLLWASPECTHHSIARGGRPINDQSRASAWCVVRWAERLRPPVILIENVPEFRNWGPIGSNGRPLKSRAGETYSAWRGALESCGYETGDTILCAADHGDVTSRKRLFVQAVRGRRKIHWPTPSHGTSLRPWRAVREIIDWTLPTPSIFDRPRPLARNTLARIWEGLRRFGGQAFIAAFDHQGSNGACVWSKHGPLSTVTTETRHCLVEPSFLLEFRGTHQRHIVGSAKSLNAPIGVISTSGAHHGLVQAFLIKYNGTGGAYSLEKPCDTITTKDRFGLVRPSVEFNGERWTLDIGFRILQPHELALAQGFPLDYKFTGTKSEVVKQIGNAVPVNLSRAIINAVLTKGGSNG